MESITDMIHAREKEHGLPPYTLRDTELLVIGQKPVPMGYDRQVPIRGVKHINKP